MSFLNQFIRLAVPSADVNTIYESQAAGEQSIILDIRTPQEHKNLSIPGSVFICIDNLARDIEKTIPHKDTVIYVHCNTGMRSLHATKILQEKGYTNSFNMKGGIFAWREAGYPVEES